MNCLVSVFASVDHSTVPRGRQFADILVIRPGKQLSP